MYLNAFQCPEHGLSRLAERILLFRHNYSCVQILEPVNNTIDITNKSIIEIVLSGNYKIKNVCINIIIYFNS